MADGRVALDEVSLARDILQYLSRHPQAKDTPEGIASWWHQQHRIERAVREVFQALELLTARGLIVGRPGPDLRRYYELNVQHLDEIARFLEEPAP